MFDIVFPTKCLGCNSPGKYICRKCLEKVTFANNICVYCLKPSVDGVTHFKCLKRGRIDACFSLWKYRGVVKFAVKSLKYKFASDVALELSENFINFAMSSNCFFIHKKCVLVPIPLYRKRENWRGFNQSELLGRAVCREMKWLFAPKLLERVVNTIPQVGMNKEKRVKNIKGAFKLNKDLLQKIPKSVPVVVFDDVVTTGSTLKEAGKVVKKAGFETVWGVTIAK